MSSVKITLNSNSPEGLMPPATHLLAQQLSAPLYHSDYQQKHPRGTYNVSLSKILGAIEEVLTEYYKAVDEKRYFNLPYGGEPKLLKAQGDLLRAIDEHFDDCEKILKCFFPKGAPFNDDIRVEDFRRHVKPYKDHVRRIVNHLKHDQGMLRSIVMYDIMEIIGYYVEGVDNKGALGPCSDVHPRNTAFSFARDLRFHFCNVYVVSHHLASAIKKIDTQISSLGISNANDFQVPLRIARQLNELSTYMYPDEVKKDYPEVIVTENAARDIKLELRLLGDKSHIQTLQKAHVTITFIGDGTTDTYKMPYSGKKPL